MKCECIETNVYKVYLYKTYYKYSKETIEGMLLKILQKLKKIYHFDIYAIFDIDCYIDDNFGMILDINREYSPFLLYSKNTDIKMRMHEVKFLYETDDFVACITEYSFGEKRDKPMMLVFFKEENGICDAVRYDATENNVSGLLNYVKTGKKFTEDHFDKNWDKGMKEILSMCDMVMVD